MRAKHYLKHKHLAKLCENLSIHLLNGKRYNKITNQIRSYQISHSVVSDSLRPHESQHARPPCPSSTPGVHSDSRPSSQWCHPAISSSVIRFCSCPQSLPASESFPMSQLFTWGGQRIDSLEKTLMLGGIGGKRRRGRQSMRCLDSSTDSMDMSLGELQELVMDREAWHAAIHGFAKIRIRLSDWTELRQKVKKN